MADEIINRERIQNYGASSYYAGRSRDSHGMNPTALALPDWLKGYDAAAQSQDAITQAMRVDVAQGYS